MTRLLLWFSLVLGLLAGPLRATWSIILVDTRTGEIAIASATCLTSFDLKLGASIVVVGKGAAAAQSFVDGSGRNRLVLFNGMGAGTDPASLLALLEAQDPAHQTRQYGIVTIDGRTAGFTGSGAGGWAGHRTGHIDMGGHRIAYAIQGNVLTGEPVVAAAEAAVLATNGDLAERLMAGMEAAAMFGGDGRCSCNMGPTGCGSPPASFTKSAHIGYMVVARQGDIDGVCTGQMGCANGSYFMDLNVANALPSDPDPVVQLRSQFNTWRQAMTGRTDHHLTEARLDRPVLRPDGTTTTEVQITLRDWNGTVLGAGAQIVGTVDPSSTGSATIGTVSDLGGGRYSVPVTAGTTAGEVLLRITVDDGSGPVLLSPRTKLRLSNDSLLVSPTFVNPGPGGRVDFALNGTAAQSNRGYVLLATASGSTPGITLGSVSLPLNPDGLTPIGVQLAAGGAFVNGLGFFDANGQSEASLTLPPRLALPLRGVPLTFAWLSLMPVDAASNAVDVYIAR